MVSLVGGSVVVAQVPVGALGYGATMDPSMRESGGARHAALLLHAMTPQDRAWMLDALPAGERDQMRGLLAELEALGIERDATLIAEATANVNAPSVPSDEAMLMALDDSGVRRAVNYLRAEPVGLIVQWLHVAPWPWREALLQALEPGQRRRLETAMADLAAALDTVAVPPALRAGLVEAVAQHVRSAPEATKLPQAPWQRIGQSLALLLGRRASVGSAPQ